MDGIFSSFQDIVNGVPQGSILGPLLFNVYINDFLFEQEDRFLSSNVGLCNYADDNTFLASGKSIENVILNLETAFSWAASWFSNNGLQLNAGKCKFIVFRKSESPKRRICLGGKFLDEIDSVKLLGVHIDNR